MDEKELFEGGTVSCSGIASTLEWLNGDTPLNVGLALAGSVVHRYSIQKARNELGYSPSVELRAAIQENLEFVLGR